MKDANPVWYYYDFYNYKNYNILNKNIFILNSL